jgi:uncharacterized protein YgbK (DUF1537 family)
MVPPSFAPFPAAEVPPPYPAAGLRQAVRRANQRAELRFVVLDDDPTGCQSVHGVPIRTDWEDPAEIRQTLLNHEVTFLLTNSRAYPAGRAAALTRSAAECIRAAVPAPRLRVISRSDSTLRGHFAAEVGTLLEVLGPFDGVLVVPYFGEGGRLTRAGTHYLVREGAWVPAHQTEFAQDPVFGYTTAYLPDWIAEQSAGRWRAADVAHLTLEQLRRGGPDAVADWLGGIRGGQPVVIDALADADLDVLALALHQAEARGQRFLYRTAASFVKMRAGLPERPLVRVPPAGPGLVVVGSHVPTSTGQLRVLLDRTGLPSVVVELAQVFGPDAPAYGQALRRQVEATLRAGTSVVVSTERTYGLTGSPTERLRAGERLTQFLCQLVQELGVRPSFIVAKGGITSLELARTGLSMRRGTVVGPLDPGVPLWELGPGSRYPGLPYVVFPGNVGDPEALYRVYLHLSTPVPA